MTLKRVFIIAGEASGDVYAGQVAAALLGERPDLEVRGWGGEALEAAGATVTQHYRDLAYMGFWEVLKHIRTISGNLDRCWAEIQGFAPDVVLGVDFPGFNLRIARKAKAHGMRVHHYISPSVWAWKKGRVRQIRRDIDHMYVTLPFEEAIYRDAGVPVTFVGHPLLDVARAQSPGKESAWRAAHGLDERPLVALLPGSRTQELQHMLPTMVEAARSLGGDVQCVVAGAPGQPPEAYAGAGLPVVFGATQSLLQFARGAWVTSGTATLEAALFNTPQVIAYKTSAFTYQLAKLLAHVDHIGLPNLLAGRLAVPELIQGACTPANLVKELNPLLQDSPARERQQEAYAEVHALLGSSGASVRVAHHILGA